jgi:predicted phage-related endonuclease
LKTIDQIQGSKEWDEHRTRFWNASDAPAMLDCSPYMSRTELLHRLHTGIAPNVDAATQRRFDDGHRFEALARPLAESIVCEDLYAVTGTNGKLSASFDGLTLMEDVGFEHKSINDSLRYTPWDDGNGDHLPLHYRVQMEHQLLVSGAECILFMASRWEGEKLIEERHCWYASDPALSAKIASGWDQFERDLAAYVPVATEIKPTGKAPDQLPALLVQVTGMVTASNLAEFKTVALGAIASVNRYLQTDQDFADAEKSVKWCSEIESRIKAAKDHALSQTASIDDLFRTMDDIAAEARRVRLDLDRLVKARKEAIKGEIVAGGVAAFAAHVRELNAAMPENYMPQVPTDFGGSIRGLKSVDSIRNAVNSELARAKIAAGEIATRIHANLATIKASGLVLPDAAALVLKAPDDLAAVLAQRVAAEKAKEEAHRARILAQEQARMEAEARAKVQAEARAAAEEMARMRGEEEEKQRAYADRIAPVITTRQQAEPVAQPAAEVVPIVELVPIADNGARLTLGQINERLSPVSISVAGLSQLGFDPVEQVKASRFYRASDLPAIARAIARHVTAAASDSFALRAA